MYKRNPRAVLTAACEGAQNTWLGHLVTLSLWLELWEGWEGALDIKMPKLTYKLRKEFLLQIFTAAPISPLSSFSSFSSSVHQCMTSNTTYSPS